MKKVLFSAIIFLFLLFTVVGCVTDLPSADTTGSETTSLDEPTEVITDEPTNEPDGTDETTEPEEETTEPEEETTEPEEETTEPEEETTKPEEETTEPEETTAPDISNTITVNSSAYETKTEFAQTNLAEIFVHYSGAREKPHAVGGKYILTGIHSLYAQADGLYAYTVKAVGALDQNGGQFVRAEIVLFKQADGTSVKGYSFHENSTGKNNIPGASGIYAAIDNGKLRLIVKAYDEAATDCFENHIYEIEIPNVPNTEIGTALTLADDGTTVYVLVDGDLYATVEMSGTIDYDRVIARDGTTVTFAKTAVVTLVDGTTETIENTLVVADCTKAKFGLAVRIPTLQFTEVSIQGFSTVTIPEFDNDEDSEETTEPAETYFAAKRLAS